MANKTVQSPVGNNCNLCVTGIYHYHYYNQHLTECWGIIDLGSKPTRIVELKSHVDG